MFEILSYHRKMSHHKMTFKETVCKRKENTRGSLKKLLKQTQMM